MQKQNSKIAFLYTNNQFTKEIIPQPKELLKKKKKKEIKTTIPFTIATKRIYYLQISSTKKVKGFHTTN